MPIELLFDVGKCLTEATTTVIAQFWGGPLDSMRFYSARTPRQFLVFPVDRTRVGYRLFASHASEIAWEGHPYAFPIGTYLIGRKMTERGGTSTTQVWKWRQNPSYTNDGLPALANPYHQLVCLVNMARGDTKFLIDTNHTVAGIQQLADAAKKLSDREAQEPSILPQLQQEELTLERAHSLIQGRDWPALQMHFLDDLSRIENHSLSQDNRSKAFQLLRAYHARNPWALLDFDAMRQVLDDIEAKIRGKRWLELSSDDEATVQQIWNTTSTCLGFAQDLRARCEKISEALENSDPDILDEGDNTGEEWKAT